MCGTVRSQRKIAAKDYLENTAEERNMDSTFQRKMEEAAHNRTG